MLSVCLDVVHSPLAPLPGVLTLIFVPGATVMSILRTRSSHTSGRVVLAVSLSMMVIMVVGGAASLLGPLVGVSRPLDTLPEAVIWIILAFFGLVWSASRRVDPVTWIFAGVRLTNIYGALACGLLAVVSILGAAQLNYSGNNHLAVVATVLDVAVLLAGVVGGWKRSSRWPLNTLLYSASFALLLTTSLRGAHLYGWDIQKEFGVASQTLSAGVWVVPANHDPFASMLSLTVLPVVLHSLVRLRLLAFFQLVVPAILALVPLAVFSTIQNVPRWINNGRRVPPRPGLAFGVVTGIIVSSVAFSSILVSITRQAMAATLFTALVTVIFDRTIAVRPAQVVIGLLVVTISFTHYTTSYLLAGTMLIAWSVGWVWSQGRLGTRRSRVQEHRSHVRSRNVLNSALVIVALASALGWNLVITRNNALANSASAFSINGIGLKTSTAQGVSLSPSRFEKVLVHDFRKSDPWMVAFPGSGSVHLRTKTAPPSPGVVPGLSRSWNVINQVLDDGLWVLLGLSLLYGLIRLGRRQSDLYSADLVGLGVAGLLIGGLSRVSGTLAAIYSPERAAIVTAILLAVPLTMYLDDLVSSLARLGERFARASMVVGTTVVGIFLLWATGLGTLFFGGFPPGSLTARGLNAQQFTVSTTEFVTAGWLRNHANSQNVVQTDLFGQLVLLSQPGKYLLVDEIVPPEVDVESYIYVSTPVLDNHITQAETPDGEYYTDYQSNVPFFNKNFYVVYSTGSTRVYH
ncbi:MAG: hypothetical protein JWM55_291 [Acidimicrobiaceae bacterium]|nr:hypothetical protein [Acidimicrobiaceae bacterium]